MFLLPCVLLFCSTPSSAVDDTAFIKTFLYKHSFYRPNLAMADGRIPFWQLEGDAMAGPEQLRLAPSVQSKRGAAWNIRPLTESQWWVVEMSVQIKGEGKIGADGMAFWFTGQKGALGTVFGGPDRWDGLVIVFDSYDNDNQGNNPSISAMLNDGNKVFDHANDGATQIFASCRMDYRNRPFPHRVRIEYREHNLWVEITDGLSPNSPLQTCISASSVYLPANGFFGISAATGGMADDHDVFSFRVTGLIPPTATDTPVAAEKSARLATKYNELKKEFDESVKKFKELHPDAKPTFRDGSQDEGLAAHKKDDTAVSYLKLVLESQTVLRTSFNRTSDLLQKLIDQSNKLAVVISSGAARTDGSAISRPEVEQILQFARDSQALSADHRSQMQQLLAKMVSLESNVLAGLEKSASGNDDSFLLGTLRPYLESLKRDLDALHASFSSERSSSQCLTQPIMFAALGVQSVVLIVTIFYRSRSDKVKFY